jgi:hypothetical protein
MVAKGGMVWDANKGGSELSLISQIDFRRKLSMQFPTAPHRVVYSGTGQYLAAARIEDTQAIFGHLLYWATATTIEEARYLTAVLNSPALTRLIGPLQARGEHNPRHFDKYVWRVPIPIYDADDLRHRRLVELAEAAEQLSATVEVSEARAFQAQRRLIREALDKEGLASEIDELVIDLVRGDVAASSVVSGARS